MNLRTHVSAARAAAYTMVATFATIGAVLLPCIAKAASAVERANVCVSLISQLPAHVFDTRTLESEVNRIWEPYGVHVDGLRGRCSAPASGPTVEVRVRSVAMSSQPAKVPPQGLASISFVAGRPEPLIDLWADEVLRATGVDLAYFYHGYAGGRPRAVFSRLLARALAHELGHYLLRSQEHSESGLMRRQYGPYEARIDDPGWFALDGDQVVALRCTLASWRGDGRAETRHEASSPSCRTRHFRGAVPVRAGAPDR